MFRFFRGKDSFFHTGDRYPILKRNNESNIKGLYVIGDISGTPDIKAALNSGYRVAHHIASLPRKDDGPCDYEAIIVGGGPAGVNAAIELQKLGVSYLLLEKRRLFGAIRNLGEMRELYLSWKGERKIQGELWFGDTTSGELVKRWEKTIADKNLNYREGEEVKEILRRDVFVVTTDKGRYLARYVVLAVGLVSLAERLNIAGEELSKVKHTLEDIEGYQGLDIFIAGDACSDVAAEAALKLSDNNRVSVACTDGAFEHINSICRKGLQEKVKEGRVSFFSAAKLKRIEAAKVLLEQNGTEKEVPNHLVFFLFPPKERAVPESTLEKCRLRLENTWDVERLVLLVLSFLLVGAFYLLKKFYPAVVSFGGRDLAGWYPALYSVVVAAFGIQAMRRWWFDPYQRKRYASLIFFQVFFFFLLPEFILYNWRAYGLVYVWPLGLSPVTLEGYTSDPSKFYFYWALLISLVGIPLLVYFKGMKYCTWICGCGGLAETLGDRWRHYSPKGEKNRRREVQIYWITVFALLSTVLVAFGWDVSWRGFSIKKLYEYTVDLFLIAIIPVALYPFLGGKVWCRYWCPVVGFMHSFGKRVKSKFVLLSDRKRCIACGMCNRYCEVGVEIMKRALKGEPITMENSSCIGCGMCITVCPTDVLSFRPKLYKIEQEKLETAAKQS